MELWGEVRQNEKRGINLLNDLPIGFGLIADTAPFGIIAEGLPVGGSGIAARMREDVDECFAFEGFFGGRPVSRRREYSLKCERCGHFPSPVRAPECRWLGRRRSDRWHVG